MARKSIPKLKTLPIPRPPTGRVPKPQVKPLVGGALSQRAMKAQAGISVPGVKTS